MTLIAFLLWVSSEWMLAADSIINESTPWAIVNDGVMGGISQSNLVMDESGEWLNFSGYLSTDNNGGFASVRGLLEQNVLAEHTHVCIRVRGDGKRYQLRFRQGRRFDGVAYVSSFQTQAGEWTEHRFAIAEFVPQFRGRRMARGPLQGDSITQLGFMIADKQVGSFSLDISRVTACSMA